MDLPLGNAQDTYFRIETSNACIRKMEQSTGILGV